LKIADFGWSINFDKMKCNSFCGTIDYVAPEVVQGSQYDETIDVWGLGVICYEFCSGN
jgi:serine/threonine protein kinase